jgi:hypothetical protein
MRAYLFPTERSKITRALTCKACFAAPYASALVAAMPFAFTAAFLTMAAELLAAFMLTVCCNLAVSSCNNPSCVAMAGPHAGGSR